MFWSTNKVLGGEFVGIVYLLIIITSVILSLHIPTIKQIIRDFFADIMKNETAFFEKFDTIEIIKGICVFGVFCLFEIPYIVKILFDTGNNFIRENLDITIVGSYFLITVLLFGKTLITSFKRVKFKRQGNDVIAEHIFYLAAIGIISRFAAIVSGIIINQFFIVNYNDIALSENLAQKGSLALLILSGY